MNPLLEDAYRAGLRELLSREGRPVRVDELMVEKYPDRPETWASRFGWEYQEASDHIRAPTEDELRWWGEKAHESIHSCGLVIPPGAKLYEVVYSEFDGTDYPHVDTLGINCFGDEEPISCSCGRYTGLTLRWEGSLSDALQSLLHGPGVVTFTI